MHGSDVSMFPAHSQQEALSLQRVLGTVRLVQQKLKAERQQLLTSVEQQVRDVRLDQLRVVEGFATSKMKLDQLLERSKLLLEGSGKFSTITQLQDSVRALDALQNGSLNRVGSVASPPPRHFTSASFSMDTPPPSKSAAQTANASSAELEKQVALLDSSLRRASEEVELLKMAVLQDRLAREDRQKMIDAEDDVVEQRIRQCETVNDSMRSELQGLRGTVRRMTETLEAIRQFESKQAAPAQFNIYELDRLAVTVDATLERIRTEHATLQGKADSLEAFTKQEEISRRQSLEKLEQVVSKLEAHVKAESESKRHAPFRPQDHDVSTEWAKSGGPGGANEVASRGAVADRKGVIAAPHLQRTLSQWSASEGAMNAVAGAKRTTQRRRDELAATLERFYAAYNPDKLVDIDHILDEYEGAEEELLAALEVHYGCFGFFSQ